MGRWGDGESDEELLWFPPIYSMNLISSRHFKIRCVYSDFVTLFNQLISLAYSLACFCISSTIVLFSKSLFIARDSEVFFPIKKFAVCPTKLIIKPNPSPLFGLGLSFLIFDVESVVSDNIAENILPPVKSNFTYDALIRAFFALILSPSLE